MKYWLVLLLLVAMLFSSAGCSFIFDRAKDKALEGISDVVGDLEDIADDSEDVSEEPAQPAGDDALVEGDFYQIETVFDFARHFKEVEYTFDNDSLNYTFIGEEEVNGVQAYHLQITTTNDLIELWVHEEEIVKAIFNDVVYEGEEAEAMGMMTAGFMWPFMMMTGWDDAFTDLEEMSWLGWKVTDQGTTSRNLGAGNVPVNTFEIEVASSGETLIYEIAKIGGRNVFIGWEVVEDGGATTMFKITKLIPQ
jgi:hypothetical protein